LTVVIFIKSKETANKKPLKTLSKFADFKKMTTSTNFDAKNLPDLTDSVKICCRFSGFLIFCQHYRQK